MHRLSIVRIDRSIPPRPAPYNVGPYTVQPVLVYGTAHHRYDIYIDARKIGSQCSAPSLDDCKTRERESTARALPPPRKGRFNNVEQRHCPTCNTTRSINQFYRTIGSRGHRREKSCRFCIDSGRAQPRGV